MKLAGLALLAAVAFSGVAVTPAIAQDRVEVHRTVTTTTRTHGPRWRHHMRRHKVCRTHWYHHRKVRRCTWQRWG
jgi:hypothetical protein